MDYISSLVASIRKVRPDLLGWYLFDQRSQNKQEIEKEKEKEEAKEKEKGEKLSLEIPIESTKSSSLGGSNDKESGTPTEGRKKVYLYLQYILSIDIYLQCSK